MPAAPVTSSAQVKLTAVDAAANQPVTRDTGGIQFAGDFGTFVARAITDSVNIATGRIILQGPSAYCVYIKNLAGVGGGSIKIRVTPAGGGADQDLGNLEPGGVFLYWNQSKTKPGTTGYQVITIYGDTLSTPFEYYIGS